MRKTILIFLTHKIGMPYFKLTRKKPETYFTTASLAKLGNHTVGFHLHEFLTMHELDLLPYYEKHDIKHIILDYPPDERGEVELQCFMLANGRWTLPVLIAVLFGWFTMPEYWKDFYTAMKRGYNNIPLNHCDWLSYIDSDYNLTKNHLIKHKKQ